MVDHPNRIIEDLRALVLERAIGIRALARLADLPVPTVQHFLNGKHYDLRVDTAVAIAKAVGASITLKRGRRGGSRLRPS